MFKINTLIGGACLSILMVCNLNLAKAHGHKATDNKGDNSSSIVITNVWARALPPVVPNGAAYLSIYNAGKKDTLLSINSSIAKRSMLHENYMVDGQVAMRHVGELTIEHEQKIDFKPGGFHIMLMGLKHPLSLDSNFTLALEFEHAGIIEVPTSVVKNKQSNAVKHHH